MAKSIRGVHGKEELNPQLERRDVRPAGQKFKDAIESGQALMIAGIISIGAMLLFPRAIEIIFVVSFLFFYWVKKQKFMLSFRLPMASELLDNNDLQPGTGTPQKARGIAFLGNEMEDKRELWFNKSDMCTHILVFGSTGAGKALRDEEEVLTPTGWKKMKTLVKGGQIITPDRQVAIITDIFPQGKQPLWRVSFEDGRFINVTADHLWGVSEIDFSEKIPSKTKTVQEVISTDEIEQRLFTRDKIKPGHDLAVPLSEAVGDSVVIWDKDEDEMHEAAIKSLLGSGEEFDEQWIEGSVKQRSNVWARIKKSGRHIPGSVHFDSNNKHALECIQKLAWSLGFWAKIEPWKNGHSLVVKTDLKWLKISSITPTHEEEDCRCIKISDSEGLFITKDWIVTHNTETLISLAYNTLVTGSGFIYVDGKGDNGLWAKIFSVARYLGREDDLRLINFMTGGDDMSLAQTERASNTLNPFITGSSAGLTELLVGLMDEAGGDNAMWKGRAISLISALLSALVWLRDNDGLLMGVELIRDYLVLEKIQALSKRSDLPVTVITSIKSYLRSLPGYDESSPKQSETVLDQHGYLQMQFTRILGSLSDTYGYIFKTNLGEVDFFDIVLNRRILIVLLPAMEKSTDELANLGKIIVGCLKQMMATGLGNKVVGSYEDVIETKPTESPSPYMCILDEYGYYVVKGASVMPAQARSLGFCMVFAGQDYPAFKKNNNAEEAVSTIGNCNIKIFMKLEDPTETYELAEKSIGETSVGRTSGLSRNTSGMGSAYQDGQNASIERRKRADWLDFKDHSEGEAHIIFKSVMVRANMFFANPPKVKDLQLNEMLRVEPPQQGEMHEFDEFLEDLKNKMLNETHMNDMVEDTISGTPAKLKAVCDSLKAYEEPMTSGMAAIGAIFKVSEQNAQMMSDKTRRLSIEELSDDDANEDDTLNIFRTDLENEEDEEEDIWAQLKKDSLGNEGNDEDEDDDDDDEDIFIDREKFTRNMSQIEQSLGMDEKEANERSENIASDMRVISSYPKTSPEPIESDEFIDFIEDLDSHLSPDNKDE